MKIPLFVFGAVGLHVLAPFLTSAYGHCHEYQERNSLPQGCSRVSLPPGLCAACPSGPDMFYTSGPNQGIYRECSITTDLSSDQCLAKLQEYVAENECDTTRSDALEQYLSSSDPSEKEQGRKTLDYFVYALCELACDCIPQIDASPLVPTISIERGNCQGHAYWDICSILPDIRIIKSSSKPWPEDSVDWPKVCPLVTDWLATPDGQNFRILPYTVVHPAVEAFLRELLDAIELLTDRTFYHNCVLLESTQGFITTSDPVRFPSVNRFTMINADTNEEMYDIKNSDTIYLDPGTNVNIRAYTRPDHIGSVHFTLNGNNFRTENEGPYALAGDNEGNYSTWAFDYGPQILKATPYSGGNAKGKMGKSQELMFTIVKSSFLNVTGFTLINADTNKELKDILDGDTIYVDPGMNISIRAHTSFPVGSVHFELNGNTNYNTDSDAPYALAGDFGGNYTTWAFGYGKQVLKATPYSGTNATDITGEAQEITFFIEQRNVKMSEQGP